MNPSVSAACRRSKPDRPCANSAHSRIRSFRASAFRLSVPSSAARKFGWVGERIGFDPPPSTRAVPVAWRARSLDKARSPHHAGYRSPPFRCPREFPDARHASFQVSRTPASNASRRHSTPAVHVECDWSGHSWRSIRMLARLHCGHCSTLIIALFLVTSPSWIGPPQEPFLTSGTLGRRQRNQRGGKESTSE